MLPAGNGPAASGCAAVSTWVMLAAWVSSTVIWLCASGRWLMAASQWQPAGIRVLSAVMRPSWVCRRTMPLPVSASLLSERISPGANGHH